MSSIPAIENKRENCPILNQIYDILTELQNQKKQLTQCKVPAHIGVKGNKEADKTGNRYARDDHKTTLYRLLPDHQEV